jgi:hypothetical protein|tara:strand:+ start:276 stop:425 length:150 start_codon:yes stop_codon:yes gene_type:complete
MEEGDHVQYEMNPADVIKEEDYEESMEGISYRKQNTSSNSKMLGVSQSN